MESYRLKNIIIMILVLLNGCLLISLSIRREAEHTSQRRAREQLVELFAQNNVTLDPDLIPDTVPPAGLTLARQPEETQALAAFFLGKTLSFSDRGGGLYQYSGESGTATFRANGSFSMLAAQSVPDPEAFCRSFCHSFHYDRLVFAIDESGNGFASAVQTYNGYPVSNCTVTFSIENGGVRSINGTHLPSGGIDSTESDSVPLSAAAALNAFLNTVREGAVVTAITDLYLCYQLQTTIAAPITLTPAWCIATDSASETVNFYVNCYSGTVSYP